MTDLLMRIFQNSIIASILFFVIQWLKPVLKHYRYDLFRTLWIVLILFLLIPVDITIPNLTQEIKVETDVVEPLSQHVVQDEIVILIPQDNIKENESYETVIPDYTVEEPESIVSSLLQRISVMDIICFAIFAIGLVLFAFQFFTYLWFQRLLELSGQKIGGDDVDWLMSDLVDSPLLTGLIHPVIALPADVLDHPHLEIMIEHEMMHYRRKDLIIKFLMMLARCLHWFNPVVYFMEKQCAKDLEMACDEAVVKNADENQRQIYAQTLLDMVSKNRFSKEAFTTQFSSDDFKTRIKSVFDTKRNKFGKIVVVFILGVLVGISLLTSIQMISSHKSIIIYQKTETQSLEYLQINGKNNIEKFEQLNNLEYTDDIYICDYTYWFEYDGHCYELAIGDHYMVIKKDEIESVLLTDQQLVDNIKTAFQIPIDDEESKTVVEQYQKPQVGRPEENAFLKFYYANVLDDLKLFSHVQSFSFNEYHTRITSSYTTIQYDYYDGLFNFYLTEYPIDYTKNDQIKTATLNIAIGLWELSRPYFEGRLTTQEGDVYFLNFDLDTLTILDGESGSATYGKPTKFLKELNDKIVDLFVKSWNQSVMQYQVLDTWNDEIMKAYDDIIGWNDIKDARTIEIDFSLIKNGSQKNEAHCSGTLVEQGALLTEMFLEAYRYTMNFNGLKNENMNAQYYMDDLVPYKDNPKHPYAYVVNRGSDGYYHIYFSDLQKMNRELFGEEKELQHYTEGIYTNTVLGRYETGFEFGYEGIGPGYDILWIQSYEVKDMIQVNFELNFYLFENYEATGETQSKLGTSYYKIINEDGNTFLRHVETTVED